MSMKKFPDSIEKRFLEEYKELGLCWRHDDEWFSKLTAVLLPLSIAALTLPYLKDGIPKLLAVAGGLMLIAFWFFSSCICTAKHSVRFSRIHDIERILGLNAHLSYHAARGEGAKKDKRLRLWMFGLYLVTTFFVMCDIKVEPTRNVIQLIRDLFDTKVDATLQVLAVDVWATAPWAIKLIELAVHSIIVGIVGYLGWKYRDRTRPNPENKA